MTSIDVKDAKPECFGDEYGVLHCWRCEWKRECVIASKKEASL